MMKFFKNKNNNNNCDDEQTIFLKKNHMQCWCNKIFMCFSTFLLLNKNVVCMIRNDEMKLCDKNMLEYDDEVSLITCDSYDQSEVSV